MKGFADENNEEYMLAKGEIELIEKAVYADTPQNRKLGRVGQEYSCAGRSTKGYNSNMSDDEINSHRSAIRFRLRCGRCDGSLIRSGKRGKVSLIRSFVFWCVLFYPSCAHLRRACMGLTL